MRNRNNGQEAVEFVLMTVLVFFGALLTVLLLGNKISSFFTADSSVVQSSKSTVSAIAGNSQSHFIPDYQTQIADTGSSEMVQTNPDGTVNITIGDIVVRNVPESIQATIQTTGASGATDNITDSMKDLVAYLQNLSNADPTNTELKNMADIALKMSDTGYIVSDAQEWFECAAQRLTSDVPIDLPADNRLCEDGTFRQTPNVCDTQVTFQNFLFEPTLVPANLDKWTTELINLNNQLQTIAQNQNQSVQNAANIINILGTQIKEISNNVKVTAVPANVKNFDDLKMGVASRTTNHKSRLIQLAGESLTKAPANDTVPP